MAFSVVAAAAFAVSMAFSVVAAATSTASAAAVLYFYLSVSKVLDYFICISFRTDQYSDLLCGDCLSESHIHFTGEEHVYFTICQKFRHGTGCASDHIAGFFYHLFDAAVIIRIYRRLKCHSSGFGSFESLSGFCEFCLGSFNNLLLLVVDFSDQGCTFCQL